MNKNQSSGLLLTPDPCAGTPTPLPPPTFIFVCENLQIIINMIGINNLRR